MVRGGSGEEMTRRRHVDCLKDVEAIVKDRAFLTPLNVIRCIALLAREVKQLRDRVATLEKEGDVDD